MSLKRFHIEFILFIGIVAGSCVSERSHFPEQEADELRASILANVAEPVIQGKVLNILEFGVDPAGDRDCKPAIDSAIRIIHNGGGGTLRFPPGKYLIEGPIHMISNLELRIEEGAELFFGGSYSDYLPAVKSRWEGTIIYNYSPFIYARGKKNLALTGGGTINGNAKDTWNSWVWKQGKGQRQVRSMNHAGVDVEVRVFGEGDYLRTSLVEFYECENILIEDLLITNAPFWCIHPVFSKNIIIRDLQFKAHNHNNDGIDPDSSEDMLIENILFDNADDCIAIKSGRDNEGRELGIPCRNILVRNCRFKGHNAVCVGSEMSGGVYNVLVENCSYAGKVRAGFYLKSNNDRGGEVSDIYARNLEFDSCQYVIEIDTDYKHEGHGHPSLFRDVYIRNLKAAYASEYGISLLGTRERPVTNLLLKDIDILNTAGGKLMIMNLDSALFSNVKIGKTVICE